MPTLILTPRYTDDAQLLWRAAEELGWDVARLVGWRVPEHLRDATEPVLYVEAMFAPTIAEEFGLCLVEPPDDWLPRLPPEYRHREVELTTLGELRRRQGEWFAKPPNDKANGRKCCTRGTALPSLPRDSADDSGEPSHGEAKTCHSPKCFPAGVYSAQSLPDYVPDADPVLVSEIVTWRTEFRCFILDRQLRTMSIYLRDGELQKESGYQCAEEELQAARTFAEGVLADARVAFPRAIVMDVGRIEDRGWAVVELNAAWGSGIYGCDPVEVLRVVQQATSGT